MKEQNINGTYVREWIREDNIANVIIVHGLGEHSGKYVHVGDYFYNKGYNVYCCDLIGHGKSHGVRTYVKSIKEYCKSIDLMINRVNNDKPLFIFGHSMGGLTVINYSVQEENPRVKGVILSSPYIKEALNVPYWKYIMAVIMNLVYPKLRFETGLKGELVCRDKEMLELYDNDELMCTSITAAWYMAMIKARQEIKEKVNNFNYPCFIMQAGSDAVADAQAVKEYYNLLSIKDKNLKMYEGYYHELVNDTEREVVFEDVDSWIRNRI